VEVLYLYNVPPKATVSLGKEGRKKNKVIMWQDKLWNKLCSVQWNKILRIK